MISCVELNDAWGERWKNLNTLKTAKIMQKLNSFSLSIG